MDAQLEILSEYTITQLHRNLNKLTSLLGKIRLMNGKKIHEIKCRMVKAVIICRCHTPNKSKEPEQYFYHLLKFYSSYGDRKLTFLEKKQTYMSKFYKPEVQAVVQHNKILLNQILIESMKHLKH